MTLQEKLEMAATVMPGVCKLRNANTGEEFMAILDSNPHSHCINCEGRWRPDTDDGDSRLLETACLNWIEGNIITCPETVDDAVRGLERARRSGDAKQYRAAVLDLAAEIGRTINAA